MADVLFNNVSLLVSFDGNAGATTSYDKSFNNHALTFSGNTNISTAQSMFGGSSAFFDGSGDYVIVPDHDSLSFAAGQFTVEAFVRMNSVTGGSAFFGKWTGSASTAEWMFNRGTAGTTLDFLFYDTGNVVRTATSSWTPVIGTWYHIAADRDAAGVIRIYVDGVMTSKTSLPQTIANRTTPLWIGARNHATPMYMNGWMDEVRITKGAARYASDAGFTPPTAPFETFDGIIAPKLVGYAVMDHPSGIASSSRMAAYAVMNTDPTHVYASKLTAYAVMDTAPPVVPKLGETLAFLGDTWSLPVNSFTQQWYRDDVAISGATAVTYQLGEDDEGAMISVGRRPIGVFGLGPEVRSVAVGPVEAVPTFTASYWRIYMPSVAKVVDQQNWVVVGEMYMRETASGANEAVSANGTPISSGSLRNTEDTTPNLVDGTLTAVWESARLSSDGYDIDETYTTPNGSPWFGFHFNVPKTITEIEIAAAFFYGLEAPREFRIQYSDDGVVWNTAWQVSTPSWGWIGAATNRVYRQVPMVLSSPRFWRMYVDAGNDATYCNVREFKYLDATDTVLSTGGRGFSGGVYSDWYPDKAFDDDPNTEWDGASPPNYLGYDMGEGRGMNPVKVSITAGSYPGEAPESFTIQYSHDNITWANAASFTGQTGWTTGETRTFDL